MLKFYFLELAIMLIPTWADPRAESVGRCVFLLDRLLFLDGGKVMASVLELSVWLFIGSAKLLSFGWLGVIVLEKLFRSSLRLEAGLIGPQLRGILLDVLLDGNLLGNRRSIPGLAVVLNGRVLIDGRSCDGRRVGVTAVQLVRLILMQRSIVNVTAERAFNRTPSVGRNGARVVTGRTRLWAVKGRDWGDLIAGQRRNRLLLVNRSCGRWWGDVLGCGRSAGRCDVGLRGRCNWLMVHLGS